MAVLALFSVLRDFGAGEYLIQAVEIDRSRLRSAVTATALLSVPLGFAVILSAGYIAEIYREPRIVPVLNILSLLFFLLPLGATANSLLRRKMRFGLISIAMCAGSVANITTATALVLSGYGVPSIAIGLVVGACVSLIVLIVRAPETFVIRPGTAYLKEIFSFGGWHSLTAIVRTVGNQGNHAYLGWALGLANLGLFARGAGLVDAFSNALMGSISSVSLSQFSEMVRRGEQVREAVLRYCATQGGLTWPFFAFLAVFAEEIILVLFGAKWLAAAPIARILCVGWIFTLNLHSTVPSLLVASGRVRTLFWTQAFVYILRFVFVVLGAALGGLLGAAAAIAFSALLLLIPYIYLLQKDYGVSGADIAGVSAHSAALTLVAIAPALALQLLPAMSTISPFPTLLLGGGATAAGYLVGCVVLRHPIRSEWLRGLRSIRRLIGPRSAIEGS